MNEEQQKTAKRHFTLLAIAIVAILTLLSLLTSTH